MIRFARFWLLFICLWALGAITAICDGQSTYQLQPMALSPSGVYCTTSGANPQTSAVGLSFTVNVSCPTGDTATGSIQLSVGSASVSGTQFTADDGQTGVMLSTPLTVTATGTVNVSGPESGVYSAVGVNFSNGFGAGENVQTCGPPSPPVASGPVTQSCTFSSLSLTGGTDNSGNPVGPGVVFQVVIGWGNQSATYQAVATYAGSGCPVTSSEDPRGPAPRCTESNPKITFDHLEVVQVIQGSGNKIPLVQGKTALVRIYAKSDMDFTPVSVTLTSQTRVDQSGNPLTIGPVLGTLHSELPDPNLWGTIDVRISGPWVAAGSDTLQVSIQAQDPTDDPINGDVQTGTSPRLTFLNNKWPQPYVVLPVLVCEFTTELNYACPGSSSGFNSVGEFLQDVFPMPDNNTVYLPAAKIQVDSFASDFSFQKLVKRFLVIYYKLAINGLAPDELIAWLNPRGGAIANANTIGRKLAQFEYPGVRFIQDERYDDPFVAASSIAAVLGASAYAPSKTDLPGWAPDLDIIPAGFAALNANGLASIFGWISSAQYNAIFDAYESSSSQNAARPQKAARAMPMANSAGEYLTISGDVAANGGSGDLDSGFLDNSDTPADSSDPNGNYCLEFSGPSGALGDYCFTVNLAGGLDPSPFAVRAPWPAGANQVGLVAANSASELASLTANVTPPTVRFTSPSAGSSHTAGTLTLSWNSTGASPLTYNLLQSSDGGTTWTPLDVNLTGTTYSVDTTQISGGSKVMFQLEASDGLNTATAKVGPLTINQKPHLTPPQGAVNFNKVQVGVGGTQQVLLQNTGNGPLTVTSASTGGSFSVIYPPVTFSIGAGGQQSVTLLCNPTSTGSVNGSLSIASSDPAQPNIVVPLQAEAVAGPESTVSLPSNSVDFGNVVVGQSTAASFQVNSLGPGILNISKFQSGNGAYSITSPSLPFSVQPGQSQAVTVKFTPAAVGEQNTVFTLTSDDPDAPSVAINATGAGVASNSGTPSYSAISVLNAASGQGGGVSPGEMVVIYGSNLGPASLAGLQLSNGAVATSAGNTQVLFDGAPAPIIYASAGQTAVMVPYEVAVGGVTEMQVVYNGVKSNVASLQVVDVIPGLFTANASGKGPGAILNQDLSVNSAANPAAPGSVVVLYGTGEGQTNPVGLDGALTGTVLPLPIAPVSVTIGGVGATVGYAGEAPGLVAGMLQVNATIPAGLGSGAQPVVVTVGGASSQPGVTVAVKGAGGTGGDTTTGLVGWWKFDEAAGSTVTDSSGNGNAGTISGGVTRVPGMFGGALSFDGSTGFITGSSPGTDFPTGSAARTITAWINITNAQTVDNALLHYGSYGGAPPAINFHLFITGTGSDAAVGNGYGFGVVQGTASVADGQWHNVAGVYEGPGTNIARIYVDGVEQSSATLTDVPDTGVATPWRIGNFLAGGGLFRGLMDDVRIYDRALSATDLQALSAGH